MKLNLSQKVSAALSVLALFLGIGTVTYHFLEGWDFATAFYFSVVTLTTVGYGNIHPTNQASMMFTAFYILLGVACVVASLSIIGSEIIAQREHQIIKKIERRQQKQEENNH